jgi:hypothetical protein
MYQVFDSVSRHWHKRYQHTIVLLLSTTIINDPVTLLSVSSNCIDAIGVGNGRGRASTLNAQQKSIPTTLSLIMLYF